MGGLPCAKTIIDQRAGVVRAMDCMSTTILLSAQNGAYPSEEMEDEFVKAAGHLAEVATRIEQAVRTGAETYSSKHDRVDKHNRKGEGL